ncbi:hypothetical protein [Variovorax sp. PAMC26660]|uniref:hypothetical protein n=1 Tax=Variovorax sp. PAMC26660 TaxID=2762322 RepID=UPI00164D8CCC|nr:hypothetical protein [Variovorax sp. PAMC26660]QNK66473.1 hypothetical protein H7F35_25230 [Variovorax sp. PAMC26660]
MPRKLIAPLLGLALSLCASAFFFWAWYARYLRWDFNELGRHYDAESQVVYTDAGFVWVFPACGFLLVALVIAVRALRRHRAHR